LRALNAPAWLTARPIAHRGLHEAAGVIENSLAAAEAAVAGRFAIECDVRLSADEEVFVFHDDDLDRLTDLSGPFAARSAAAIRGARLTGSEEAPPSFADFLARVRGRTPIVCELKSGFDRDWRLGDRIVPFAASYEGPLAFKSFDPDLVAYLRLRWPELGPAGRPSPVGIVAEASYEDPYWDFLTAQQRQSFEAFDHRDRSLPDFLSWNVDDLPHKTPFFQKHLHKLPVMVWTVRTPDQREAARKWADQIVFERSLS
jgi:glycerophosphoryl diester phosphodiesterase